MPRVGGADASPSPPLREWASSKSIPSWFSLCSLRLCAQFFQVELRAETQRAQREPRGLRPSRAGGERETLGRGGFAILANRIDTERRRQIQSPMTFIPDCPAGIMPCH